MANEKRTIQSFFAPVAKKLSRRRKPRGGERGFREGGGGENKGGTRLVKLHPQMRSASAQSRTSRWP